MRKNLLLMLAVCLASFSSFATTHTITVGNFAFSPSTMPGVTLGDTILFTWTSGSHTTTSTSVPAGAATWDNPMNNSSTTFKYVPAVAGTYNYHCTPHASMGMTGSFVVTAPTAVPTVAGSDLFSMYPNPAGNTLHLQFAAAGATTVSIYNIAGQQLLSSTFSGADAQLNVSTLANGIYMIRATQAGSTLIRTVAISH